MNFLIYFQDYNDFPLVEQRYITQKVRDRSEGIKELMDFIGYDDNGQNSIIILDVYEL